MVQKLQMEEQKQGDEMQEKDMFLFPHSVYPDIVKKGYAKKYMTDWLKETQ